MKPHRIVMLDAAEFARAQVEFLEASVAVWREIDRLNGQPDGYKGIASSTELRRHERGAWERYRDLLDAGQGAAA